MKSIKTYILLVWSVLFAAMALSGCMEESLVQTTAQPASNGVSYNADGTLNVSVEMKIPDMTLAQTRAMGDENLGALGIYMLVFEDEEGLKQFAKLSAKETVADDTHTGSTLVKFSAKLEPTEKKAVVHLIATDQPEFATQVSFGTEERVITSLYTDDNHEAYWQRIDLGDNIPSKEKATEVEGKEKEYDEKEAQKAADIKEKLTHIPMVRNFCKVTVNTSESMTYGAGYSDFNITGLYVLNTVDRGTVAPYLASYTETDGFLNFYDIDKNNNGKYVGLSYRKITDELKYQGAMPAGVKLINKLDGDIQTKSEGNVGAVYFYERPARTNSTERTYVVIKAEYKKNGKSATGFYKLDIGHIYDNITEKEPDKYEQDMIGLFEYYNLLRNFHYNIVINSVEGDGYASLSDAAKGPVFNNMSASVEARNMSSISDGEDWIYVSRTSYVFTAKDEKLNLLAQFRVNVGNGVNVRNDYLKYAYDRNGSVINSVTEQIDAANSPDAYNTYTITSYEPTDELQRQEFYVYRGNKSTSEVPNYGLYRIVTLFLHKPWQFRHMDTFPGLWDQMDDMPSWEWSEDRREVGQSKGSPLTLFFELPPDLPQAIFPLEFVIESDRQNIQNAYAGNAVVRSVPAKESLFAMEPLVGTQPNSSRIQYVKTVTWEDYYGKWDESQLVGQGSVVVRCRFLTITDLEQSGVGGTGTAGESTTMLRVYNPYFGSYIKVKDAGGNETDVWADFSQDGFERTTATSDPSPRFWDFNSAYWDQIMFEMNGTSRAAYRRENNLTDELIFVEGAKNSMSNDREGENKDGVRYIRTSNTGDALTHKHTYPKAQDRIIRLEVVSTDYNGTPTPPKITFDGINDGLTMTAPTEPTETKDADDDGKKIYIYEIEVPENVTQLYVDIKPSTYNGVMRFYKVNFYPRWDEFDVENKE